MRHFVYLCAILLLRSSAVFGQAEEADPSICEGKVFGEYFRIKNNCRDVAVCSEEGVALLKCPSGLNFDIDAQTCKWERDVKNCNATTKAYKPLPLLNTETPLCEAGKLACGDGNCIKRTLFCDGKRDCNDGSDENLCGPDTDPNRPPECDVNACQPPACYCSKTGTEIPGGLSLEETPQMIAITFDDAVNPDNFELYMYDLFTGERRNPNNCTIRGTMFVSHRYTDYSMIHDLHRNGHEIALHSITHNNDESYWSEASVETWNREMSDLRKLMAKFADIPAEDIKGARSPLLRLGGNNQFEMYANNSFLYDSTMVAPLHDPPFWPYTLDYRVPHRCVGNSQKCPTRSYPVFEMILNEWTTDPLHGHGTGCAMVDSCGILDEDTLYDVLTENFLRHFDSNRAPLGIYMHAAWFVRNPTMRDTFLEWIDDVQASFPEAYFVTMTDVISWIQNPTPLDQLHDFEPWKNRSCTPEDVPRSKCSRKNTVCRNLRGRGVGSRNRMDICNGQCPNHYPWLNDPLGRGVQK